MSAYEDLATPAPKVESAQAERAIVSDELKVEAAVPSEDVKVEPAKQVEAADDLKEFSPAFQPEEASHLSVAALRGSGSEFESQAAVIQGPVPKNLLRKYLPLFFDERDFVSYGEVLRYVFVKGNFIFVYSDAHSPIPLYAIQIATVRAEKEDSKHPDKNSFTISPRANTNEARENLVTILLRDKKTNSIAYQVTFDTTEDKSVAKRFLDMFARNAKHYVEVLTASVVKAKAVGAKTAK